MAITFNQPPRSDEFVVVGDWVDKEYIDLQQQSTRRTLTFEEWKRLVAGPRRHPFGPDAEEVNVDGQWVVFAPRARENETPAVVEEATAPVVEGDKEWWE